MHVVNTTDVDIDVDVVKWRAQAEASMPASYNPFTILLFAKILHIKLACYFHYASTVRVFVTAFCYSVLIFLF